MLPFDADEPWVREVDGEQMPDYLGWMRSAYIISVLRGPAASVPAGFTPAGLPVGLQVMAPPLADDQLYRVGAALERELRSRWGGSLLDRIPQLEVATR